MFNVLNFIVQFFYHNSKTALMFQVDLARKRLTSLSKLPRCDWHGANRTTALGRTTFAISSAMCVYIAGTSAELHR